MNQLAIELPASLAAAVRRLASANELSIDDYVRSLLTAHVEFEAFRKRFEERAKRADADAVLEILARVPDAPPMPGDELPEDLRRHLEAKLRRASVKRAPVAKPRPRETLRKKAVG